jgi:hypothetical protein
MRIVRRQLKLDLLAIELVDATDSRLGACRSHVALAPGSRSDLVLTARDRVKSD